MDLSVLRWPFCGLPLLPLHSSDPTYRIHARDTQVPYQFTCHEAYRFRLRATRDLLSNRIAFVWARVETPCPSTPSPIPTPARWPTGILPSGEVCRVMRYFGAAAERAWGRDRMGSAAALIGLQPCDSFHCLLGVSPGAGDDSVGSREWWLHWRWWLAFMWRILLFISVGGMGGRGRWWCGPYPRTCHS